MNVLVAIINLVFGYRKVVHFMTFGLFGREGSKNTFVFMFLFPLGLQLSGNTVIAYIYRHTPGYGQGFSIGDLSGPGTEVADAKFKKHLMDIC